MPDFPIILTDRFPNLTAFERVVSKSNGTITYVADSVDARAVPPNIVGFRTLFNAFHHFRPDDAVQVLRDAAHAGQPIGIFEAPDRRWRALIPIILFVPIMVAFLTPFIRPFRWSRLFWTYVIPLVPLTVWWDGIVSQLRAYSVSELEAMAKQVGEEGFVWHAGTVPIGTVPGRLTYLIGYPKIDPP